MSLNFVSIDNGAGICKIVNKDDDLTVYVNSNKDGQQNIKCKDDDKIQPIPDKKLSRSVVYASGKSGSGKSYFCMKYAKEYQKQNPKNEVILFSSLTSDAGSLDKIKGLKKMNLDIEFLRDPDLLKIDNYKDCLVIFDDVDCIADKVLKTKVRAILDVILQTGRHSHTSCLYTSHLSCKGAETKLILNEAHLIVYFPDGTPPNTVNNLLENYIGLDKKQIKRVNEIESRWIAVNNCSPPVLMYETGVKMLKTI